MRYAFLTTEFPTTLPNAGGLSTYTHRMAKIMTEEGHDVEVFVLNERREDSITFEGYAVHHVRFEKKRPLASRVLNAARMRRAAFSWDFMAAAKAIAAALEKRHAQQPFDVVQSSDHLGVGNAVRNHRDRVHLVRCSAAMDLYMHADGLTDEKSAAQTQAESLAVARADIAIAPSELVAGHYRALLSREVRVVRPPAFLEIEPATMPIWAPRRFLVHFAGVLGARKGTALIARALPDALAQEPDLIMLWIGRLPTGTLTADLTVHRENVLAVHPLGKPYLYALLREAVAVVLPSRVDNTPNALIESLLLHAPVIITSGSSLDELVDRGPGVEIVGPDDTAAMTQALVKAWRNQLGHSAGPWIEGEKGRVFSPSVALFAHLAVLREHGVSC